MGGGHGRNPGGWLITVTLFALHREMSMKAHDGTEREGGEVLSEGLAGRA